MHLSGKFSTSHFRRTDIGHQAGVEMTECEGEVVPVHAMNSCSGVHTQFNSLFTSEIDAGQWSNSHSGRFNSVEMCPGFH